MQEEEETRPRNRFCAVLKVPTGSKRMQECARLLIGQSKYDWMSTTSNGEEFLAEYGSE
jgi:hypothetical protein